MKKILLFALLSLFLIVLNVKSQFISQNENQINPLKTGENFVVNHSKDYSSIPGVNINGKTRASSIDGSDAMNQYTAVRTTGITFNSISVSGNTYPGWRNGVSTDDNLSTSTPIGFTFVYNGIPYTTFSVSTNGFLTLNTATVATGSGNLAYGYDNTQFTSTTGTLTTIAGFYDDLVCPGNPGTLAGLNASLRYQLTGSAPNRILTAEWIGFEQFNVPGPNLNWQVKLYEFDGHIELVYGTMDPTGGSFTYTLGINAQTLSAVPLPAELLTQQTQNTGTFSNTPQNALATVPANLTQITFNTPPAPNGSPSNLTFSATSSSGTTLTWNDNSSNELGFPVYRSTDGINYSYIGSAAAGAGSTQSITISGLTPSTLYYFQVYASTEGQLSPGFASGQVTTLATVPICGTKSIGPTGNYASITAAVSDLAASGMCGPVILELQPAYLSAVETFPLSFTTITQLSSTNTLTVRPQTGATSRIITSANTTATIDLNNVQYVNFDGRQGGAGTNKDLQLDNSSISGTVVRFINSAANCSIRYCTVTGVETSTVNGVLFFSTTTGLVQGNSNNTIDNCDIKDGVTTPLNLIYSSGTTTASLLNSGNTVSNCNMLNYFGASSATNGIFLTSGNTAWTISNDRFFQAVSRTYTSGTTHAAIRISSTSGGAGGFNISNNTIGYSSSAGTGTYTMLGAVTSTFIGISLAQTITGTVSNVQGNNITAFNLTTTSAASTTTGIWCGISVTQGDCNIGTTAANFIGDAVSTGAITITTSGSGGLVVGINDNSTGNITINNTTIGSITANGSTALIATAINAINVTTGIPTITNNTIGSPTIANSINNPTVCTTATAGTVFGINITVVTGTTTINNNVISNLNNAGTTTAHVTRGIIYSSTSPITINNNTISNLLSAGSLTGVTGLANVNGIVITGVALGGAQVKGNTISTLNSSNAGVFATATVGIAISNPANEEVSFNKIYDLRNASTQTLATTPPVCVGIQFRAGPDSIRIYNNMVSLGNGQTTNTEFIGILNNFSTIAFMKTSFNSVNIEGTATAGALPTHCFYRGDFGVGNAIGTPVIIYNNIFNNTRSGGTGKHYAIGNQHSTPSTNWVAGNVNNNVLNAPNAAIIGLWGAATDQSFTQWKTSSLNDAQSLSGVSVVFTASATGNLHLNFGTTPTGIESGGKVYAGINTDIDGQTRPGPAGSVNGGATAPDIGADEFDGVPGDVLAPVITYTTLGNGPVSATRSFTNVTATDNSGINVTSGTKPRVYYKKLGDANDLTGWKFVEANGTTSPFDFTINYALLNAGSVTLGDQVQYFVVAQDNAATPNVAINSGTFTTQPSSVNLVSGNFPLTGTINQYTITANTYSGALTLGTLGGENFTSLTNAGGFFDALNNGALSGSVTLNITSDLLAETGAIALNPIAEDGTGGYTVTITPGTSGLKTISGNPGGTVPLIKLSGSKRVIFDGRYRGAGTFLTIANTNITAATGGEAFLINNGAQNITLEYLTIKGNSQNLGAFVGGAIINIAGTTGSSGNSNITIDNCSISNFTGSNPYIGIAVWGQSQSLNNTNINITNSNIFDWGVSSAAVNCMGIWLNNASAVTISGNSMYRTTPITAAALYDFIFESPSGTGAGNTITGNYIGGGAPLCGGTAYTITSSSGCYCVDISDAALHTTSTTITNNTIKNIAMTSTSTVSTIVLCGIFFRTTNGACSISGNQIGDNTVDASTSPSIVLTNTSAGLTHSLEAIDSRSGSGAISNNNVGGIRSLRTSTGLNSMNIIFSGVQGTKNITGNLIGASSTDKITSNKISNEEIERLKKLPNYGPGENPPVKEKSTSQFTLLTKEGRVLIVPSTNDAVIQPSENDNIIQDKNKEMSEKLKIEHERMNSSNQKDNISLKEQNNINNNNTGIYVNPNNSKNQAVNNNIKQKGDNVVSTFANISQEAPSQLVPIFSSALGGTISNNTIANIVVNTGAVTAFIFNGINLSNSSSPSQNDVVTNNTVRNINIIASVANTALFITVATTYPGTATITGNTVGTISIAPTVAAAIGMTGIQSTGTGFHNISNNTITDISCGNNLTGGAYSGIVVANTSPATMIVNSNTIQNFTLNSGVSSLHTLSCLSLSGSGDFTVNSNTINNIITNSNSSNSTSGTNVFAGLFLTLSSGTNSPNVNTVNANTITNITANPFTSTTSIKMEGILQNASGSTYNFTKNYITGFLTTSTSTSTQVNGYYGYIASRHTFSNNIFDLGTGITTDVLVQTLFDDSDSPLSYFYNNTIRVRGTVTSGISPTAAFFRNSTATPITDMRNNIFSNERTGGTGSHMAISNIGGPSGWTLSNYNDYYSTNPATIGRWNSATDLTLAQWKTNSSQDAQTFSSLPSFTATSRISNNLNVSGRGDFISSITTDIDGNTRPTSQSTTVKPVDVGACQYIPASYSGNTCTLNGSIYQDGGLNSVEIVSGAFSVSSVAQYTGVRAPFNGGATEPWIYWEMPGFTVSTEPIVLRFYYNVNMLSTITESNLRVTYWTGTAWENNFLPQSINTSSHYVQVTLPTGYTWDPSSRFAIEGTNSPLPVTLASFNAAASGRDAIVTWVTSSEMNNRGFYLERRAKTGVNVFSQWQSVSFVNGHGNSSTNITYSYSDKKLAAGDYQYRLKQVDFNGNIQYHDMTGQQDLVIGKPMSSDMFQNYPNPSNPKSKIDYQIPFDGKVSIKVYDLTGREIITLVDKTQQAGYYTAEFDGSNLASGTYFYRIISEGDNQKFSKTLKMVLVK